MDSSDKLDETMDEEGAATASDLDTKTANETGIAAEYLNPQWRLLFCCNQASKSDA
jgi:hypothetical protein